MSVYLKTRAELVKKVGGRVELRNPQRRRFQNYWNPEREFCGFLGNDIFSGFRENILTTQFFTVNVSHGFQLRSVERVRIFLEPSQGIQIEIGCILKIILPYQTPIMLNGTTYEFHSIISIFYTVSFAKNSCISKFLQIVDKHFTICCGKNILQSYVLYYY